MALEVGMYERQEASGVESAHLSCHRLRITVLVGCALLRGGVGAPPAGGGCEPDHHGDHPRSAAPFLTHLSDPPRCRPSGGGSTGCAHLGLGGLNGCANPPNCAWRPMVSMHSSADSTRAPTSRARALQNLPTVAAAMRPLQPRFREYYDRCRLGILLKRQGSRMP